MVVCGTIPGMNNMVECTTCIEEISTEGAIPYSLNLSPINDQDQRIVKLSCNHFFHLNCIHQWLNTTVEGSDPVRLNNTCPICRTVVVTSIASCKDFCKHAYFAMRETHLYAMVVLTALLVPALPFLAIPLLVTYYAMMKSLDWIVGGDFESTRSINYIEKMSVFLLCTLCSPFVATFLTAIKIVDLVIVQPYESISGSRVIEEPGFDYEVDSHCEEVIRRIAEGLLHNSPESSLSF